MKNCPFCGHAFDPQEACSSCRGCAMAGTCGKICCPQCGYELAPDPWRPRWRRRRRGDRTGRQEGFTGLRPATRLEVGQAGTVEHVDSDNAADLRKLAALGIFPGRQICLIQRFPAYVFRLGFTTVALDKDLAGYIQVRVDKDAGLDYKNNQ